MSCLEKNFTYVCGYLSLSRYIYSFVCIQGRCLIQRLTNCMNYCCQLCIFLSDSFSLPNLPSVTYFSKVFDHAVCTFIFAKLSKLLFVYSVNLSAFYLFSLKNLCSTNHALTKFS